MALLNVQRKKNILWTFFMSWVMSGITKFKVCTTIKFYSEVERFAHRADCVLPDVLNN